MPYIDKSERQYYALPPEVSHSLSKPGHLNYLFTQAIIAYLRNKGESYQTYNDIIGALEACKLEAYRRKIADYENSKIKQNGDCY